MIKPLLSTMQKIERRKIERNEADHQFESHRDICPTCNGKSFFDIKTATHECEEGFRLAMKASFAHRAVREIC